MTCYGSINKADCICELIVPLIRGKCENVPVVKNRPCNCPTYLFVTVLSFHSDCEVYSKNHAAPFSKVITFHKKEHFDLQAFYSTSQDLPFPDTAIGGMCYEA